MNRTGRPGLDAYKATAAERFYVGERTCLHPKDGSNWEGYAGTRTYLYKSSRPSALAKYSSLSRSTEAETGVKWASTCECVNQRAGCVGCGSLHNS